MPSINHLGAGVSSVEKPKDYFANINAKKTQNATTAVKTNSSTFNKLVKNSKSNSARPLQPNDVGQKKTNGTDLALKQLSSQIEKQMLGIMWNMAFSTIDKKFEGGLGEEIFHKELVTEMVKAINKDDKMGNIATSVYNDLKKKEPK